MYIHVYYSVRVSIPVCRLCEERYKSVRVHVYINMHMHMYMYMYMYIQVHVHCTNVLLQSSRKSVLWHEGVSEWADTALQIQRVLYCCQQRMCV